MASTYQLFQRAERVEALSAAIYGALAGRYRSDPQARALFEALEGEELQHASRVRLLAAHYRNDPKLVDGIEPDAAVLDGCISECAQALSEIQAGGWDGDLPEVKRRLAALEEHVSLAHAELLARNAHAPIRAFLAQLAAQDGAHARLLSR